EINQNYGDFFEAFGSVHFLNENALDELERIKSLGIKGIKLHPDYQDFMVDEKKLYPIYEKCEELGLVVVFHAGYDCYSPNLIHTPPKLSKKIIKDFPKLKIVLAHFGGLEQWDEVSKYLVGENVYFDTSMCATFAKSNQIENLIKNHDDNKILLGSDCPWENPKDSINFILNMNLSDETKIKILSGNAKKIFL
ncbi:MAG: amidohydrolase family protein, partial [Oscillospiraceae bacterium]